MISWIIQQSTDKNYIFAIAKEMGWYDNPPKVQVKLYSGFEKWYVIEPYEENCNCPFLIPRPPLPKNVG